MKKQRRFYGQSLIEFIFILPIFILLTAVFIDLGRAIFYYSSLNNAVREATRYSIVNSGLSENDIRDKVEEFAFALTNTPNPLDREKIIITYPTVENETRITISIRATYMFTPLTPGLIDILEAMGSPDGIELVAQSTMRISGVIR